MHIAAVLDLMNRVVVRGVAGQRESYRPIQSGLTKSTAPVDVVEALLEAFPLKVFYLADLDAIGGGEPNWKAYGQIVERVEELWIDAGVSTPAAARRLAEFSTGECRLSRIIVGLESLTRAEDLKSTFDQLDPEKAVFSLDLKQGRPFTAIDAWRAAPPMAIAERALDAGYRQMIVLDLAGVGTGQGVPAADLCRQIKAAHPHVQLTSGGGVRHLDDLRHLAQAGCGAALVASALHDGRLTRSDLLAAAEF
jgi:phosphoribosylformimino-5-aminoimidazole carboxamide ribotide isomerase